MNKNKKVFMWYKIKELRSKGLTKVQIARELGIDRGTVRRYMGMDEETFIAWTRHPRRMPKKLSMYYKYVKGLLESTPYLSAAQVEDRLRENFEDLPEVHSKTIFNFVKSIRERYNIPKSAIKKPRVYEKLPEVAYGSEAQVDFGEHTMQTVDGGRTKIYFFVMVLSRSRYKFVCMQGSPFTTATTVYAHGLAFSYFGGIPKRIIYDQDKVLIHSENLGDMLLTNGFRSFNKQYPFDAVFCRKSDPESKGKVENVVKYVKYNFLQGRGYRDLATLQKECDAWLLRTANARVHGSTKKIPKQEWILEKEHLLPYSGVPIEPIAKLPLYKVRKDNTVAYKGNFYSLPAGTYQHNGTRVHLTENAGILVLTDIKGELLANHRIPMGKGHYVHNREHKRQRSKTCMEKRALLLQELGNTPMAEEYLAAMQQDRPRYFYDNIRVILKMAVTADKPTLKQTLDFCLQNKIFHGGRFEEIYQHYLRESLRVRQYGNVAIDTVVTTAAQDNDMVPTKSDIGVYQNLM